MDCPFNSENKRTNTPRFWGRDLVIDDLDQTALEGGELSEQGRHS